VHFIFALFSSPCSNFITSNLKPPFCSWATLSPILLDSSVSLRRLSYLFAIAMTASPSSSSGSSWYLFKCEHRSPSAPPAAGCDLNFLHTHFEWASCKVPSPLRRPCPSVRLSVCPSGGIWRTDSEDNTAWHWLNQVFSLSFRSLGPALSPVSTPCQSALKSQNSRGERWQVTR